MIIYLASHPLPIMLSFRSLTEVILSTMKTNMSLEGGGAPLNVETLLPFPKSVCLRSFLSTVKIQTVISSL
jgi:hypothetical protein